jgi:peptide/nickel transport system permease protein
MGHKSGFAEVALMRFADFFQVLPTLLFSMVIVALSGASLPINTLAEFLRIRELEYVMASRAPEASNTKLMFKVIHARRAILKANLN